MLCRHRTFKRQFFQEQTAISSWTHMYNNYVDHEILFKIVTLDWMENDAHRKEKTIFGIEGIYVLLLHFFRLILHFTDVDGLNTLLLIWDRKIGPFYPMHHATLVNMWNTKALKIYNKVILFVCQEINYTCSIRERVIYKPKQRPNDRRRFCYTKSPWIIK